MNNKVCIVVVSGLIALFLAGFFICKSQKDELQKEIKVYTADIELLKNENKIMLEAIKVMVEHIKENADEDDIVYIEYLVQELENGKR